MKQTTTRPPAPDTIFLGGSCPEMTGARLGQERKNKRKKGEMPPSAKGTVQHRLAKPIGTVNPEENYPAVSQ